MDVNANLVVIFLLFCGLANCFSFHHRVAVYYRALVNFTNSLVYGPELEDIFSPAFNEISEAVVDTVCPVLIE